MSITRHCLTFVVHQWSRRRVSLNLRVLFWCLCTGTDMTWLCVPMCRHTLTACRSWRKRPILMAERRYVDLATVLHYNCLWPLGMTHDLWFLHGFYSSYCHITSWSPIGWLSKLMAAGHFFRRGGHFYFEIWTNVHFSQGLSLVTSVDIFRCVGGQNILKI